jgi:hypothetical protein
MARGRIISKTIGHSEKLATLYVHHKKIAEFAILFFTWIIPHTDCYGQISASPLSLKLEVMPASPRSLVDFKSALIALAETNLIELHKTENVLRIINFEQYQTFRKDRPRINKYPDLSWCNNGKPRYDNGSPQDKLSEEKLSEDNIDEKKLPPCSVKEFVEAWNLKAKPVGLSACKAITKSRTAKIKTRLNEHPDIKYWEHILLKITQNNFLLGENNRGWRITIDWLIDNDTRYVKILEGAYDKQSQADKAKEKRMKDGEEYERQMEAEE